MAFPAMRRRTGGRVLLAAAVALYVWVPSQTSNDAFVPAPQAAAPRVSAPQKALDVEVIQPETALPRASMMGTPKATSGGSIAAAALAVAAITCSKRSGSTARKFFAQEEAPAPPPPAPIETGGPKDASSAVLALGIIAGWVGVMYAIQHSIIALPFLDASGALYFPIIATFIAGYGVIVLEETLEINKAPTALVLGVLIWVFVGTGLDLTPEQFNTDIKEVLEDVSEVVFFLLGALTIVEIMDAHKGFDIITNSIQAKKSRDLLLVIGILTFVLSSVLNNLTVVIVMIALLQKVVKDVPFRMQLGGLVVVASNAGGAWTPIGDITTTMFYIGGQVTTGPLIGNLLLPSILCLIGCLGYEYVQMDGETEFERPTTDPSEDQTTPNGQGLVFWGGLVGMVTVPVFTAVTQCPAWSGMMLVLGLLGVCTSLLHKEGDDRYSLKGALERVEVPDALFFLGVLFAVGGLERIGLLKTFAGQLTSLVPSDALVAILLGFASAVVDNVPLVAASQGMYDLTAHPPNDPLWNLITYCAATGGSLLVIGSAAGVAFMGLEKEVSFGWYVSKVTPPALVGYFAGVAGIVAQQSLGLAFK